MNQHDLATLLIRHNCDKARKHHYHLVYGPPFESKQNEECNILEIGIFNGASTRAFLEYMPKATFYGIDIFERTKMEDIDIHSHPRVNWIQSGSDDKNVINLIKEQWGEDIKFDFVIDDGAHWHKAQRETFENCFQFLKEDGTYWIEDIWPMHIMTDSQKQHRWITSPKRKDLYTIEENEKLLNTLKQYNFREIDHRKNTGQPDSFIYEVKGK